MAINMDDLRRKLDKAASAKPESAKSIAHFELDADGEEYMPVGIGGVLAASEKLLAVNRGLTSEDERDNQRYQKLLRPSSMLRESIKMDAGKVARTALYRVAKNKNLSGLNPYAFDPYVERLLIGNPLTAPLEEINPMQLTENARRITKMGPGGIGSEQAVTTAMQSIHPSQFGFISPIEGPESGKAGVDVRMAWGTAIGSNGRLYQQFNDKKSGKRVWLCPEDLDGATVKIPD